MTLGVRCSTGTYVRSIARDLGDGLGVGGHLTSLRRTAVGPFGLDEARTLGELEEEWRARAPGRRGPRGASPSYDLDEHQATDVRFGRKLPVRPRARPAPVAVFAPDGELPRALRAGGRTARALAVFTG